tara:strand:- start:34171 stop:34554 length:384 start_codon:yes stop_codon:yes gene_type:complete
MALDKEDILALISILKKGLEDDSDIPEEKVVSRNTNKKNISSSKKSSSKKKNKKVNKFSDMSEFKMHKEDIEIDKRLNVTPPSPRTRSFSMVDVVCRVCGKKETVSPASITESSGRHKCNKCCTLPG